MGLLPLIIFSSAGGCRIWVHGGKRRYGRFSAAERWILARLEAGGIRPRMLKKLPQQKVPLLGQGLGPRLP